MLDPLPDMTVPVALLVVRKMLRLTRAADRFNRDVAEAGFPQVNERTFADQCDDALTVLIRAAHIEGARGHSIDNWIARVLYGAERREQRSSSKK